MWSCSKGIVFEWNVWPVATALGSDKIVGFQTFAIYTTHSDIFIATVILEYSN